MKIYYFFIKILKYLKFKRVKFGRNVFLHKDSVFEGNNKILSSTYFKGKLGFGSYIGFNCNINAKIGKYCSIASNVKVIQGFHPSSTFVSTHPSFYSSNKIVGFSFVKNTIYEEYRFSDNKNKYAVEVGNDVWIGEGAKLLAGIKIGDGAIIATGAVVTKDVGPYEIVGGVPAKVLKKRFSDEYIRELIAFKWWDKDIRWIKEHSCFFSNIDAFCSFINASKEGIN